MIPPATDDLQISLGETFQSKTNTRHEPLGISILGLDICLNPVQLQVFEPIA
jgi:hypothetical protein